jgi:REP element-mobilizing transposase RayT
MDSCLSDVMMRDEVSTDNVVGASDHIHIHLSAPTRCDHYAKQQCGDSTHLSASTRMQRRFTYGRAQRHVFSAHTAS